MGVRLQATSNNQPTVRINRKKMAGTNGSVALPIDRPFAAELQIKLGANARDSCFPFDPSSQAWVKLMIDGETVLAESCTTVRALTPRWRITYGITIASNPSIVHLQHAQVVKIPG